MSDGERNTGIEQKSAASANKVVGPAIERAKAKNARLRLMKERNENYLAEHKDEPQAYEELPSDMGSAAE